MPHTPLNPRKLPQQSRAKATHDAILDAAIHIIRCGGLASFNTNAVAERAGVSIGSLYQYFPNKDALMVALIARQQQQQVDRVVEAAAELGEASLDSAIRSLIRAGMHHHHADALLASAIDHEEARLPVDAIISEQLDRGGALIAQLLGQHLPHLPEAVLGRAARTLPAMVRAIVDNWANLSPPQLDAAEEEAVHAVLGYLHSVSEKCVRARQQPGAEQK